MAISTDRVAEIAREEGVDPKDALTIFAKESSSGTDARQNVSHDGGVTGPFQIKPATFNSVMPEGGDINNAEDNVRAGIRYYKQGLENAGGDKSLAAKFYFAGPDVKGWGPKTEAYARDFVSKVDMQPSSEDVSSSSGSSSASVPVSAALQDVPFDGSTYAKQMFPTVKSAAADVVNQADAQQDAMRTLQAQFNANINSLITAQGGKGDARAQVFTAQAAVDAAQGLQSAKMLTDLGINRDDIDNFAARTTQDMLRRAVRTQELAQGIADKESKIPTLLDNPIGYVVGHLMLKGDINEHNRQNSLFNESAQKIKGLTQAADQLEQSNLPKLGVLKAQASLALGQEAIATAKEAMAKTQVDAIHTNSGFIQEPLRASVAKLQGIESTIRVAEMMAAHGSAEEQRQANMILKQAKADAEAAQLEGINVIAATLGRKPFASLSEYNRLPLPNRKAFEQISSSGGETLGMNVAEAVKNVEMSGQPSQMSTDLRYMYSMTASLDQVEKNKIVKDPMITNKKSEATAELRSKNIEAEFSKMQNDPTYSPIPKLGNPYRAPDIDTMLSDPDFVKTPLAKILADVRAGSPASVVNDGFVIGTVKEKLKSAEGYPGGLEQAARDLTTYYGAAKKLNNAAYKFEAWKLPKQEIYNIDGKDWSNYKDVMVNLTKTTLFEKLQGLSENFLGLGTGAGSGQQPTTIGY